MKCKNNDNKLPGISGGYSEWPPKPDKLDGEGGV